MDPDEQRAAQRERWTQAAAGWAARREDFQRFAMPVSRWLLDVARLQPGQRVLELAAGPGDTGFLAAELVQPGGSVLTSDVAEPMLDVAWRRARDLQLSNVDFKLIDIEWIDEPAASFDAILCRWGFMFATDPEAAFREARRVLRPGGRIALAAWDRLELNAWSAEVGAELLEQGLTAPPEPGAPGPFALARPGRLRELLENTGFAEVEVRPLELEWVHASFDAYWDTTRDLSRALADALALTDARGAEVLRMGLQKRLSRYADVDGTIRLPARALLAGADA